MVGFIIDTAKNCGLIQQHVGVLPRLDPVLCPVHALAMRLISMFGDLGQPSFLGEPDWKERDWHDKQQYPVVQQDASFMHKNFNRLLDNRIESQKELLAHGNRRLNTGRGGKTTNSQAPRQQVQKTLAARSVPQEAVQAKARSYGKAPTGGANAVQHQHYLTKPDIQATVAIAMGGRGSRGLEDYRVPRAWVGVLPDEEQELLPQLIPWLQEAADAVMKEINEASGTGHGPAWTKPKRGKRLLKKRARVIGCIQFAMESFLKCSASRPLKDTTPKEGAPWEDPGPPQVDLKAKPLYQQSQHPVYAKLSESGLFETEEFKNLASRVSDAEVSFNAQQTKSPENTVQTQLDILDVAFEHERQRNRDREKELEERHTEREKNWKRDKKKLESEVERLTGIIMEVRQGHTERLHDPTSPRGEAGSSQGLSSHSPPHEGPARKVEPMMQTGTKNRTLAVVWSFWDGARDDDGGARRHEIAGQETAGAGRKLKPAETLWRPFTPTQKQQWVRYNRLYRAMDMKACELAKNKLRNEFHSRDQDIMDWVHEVELRWEHLDKKCFAFLSTSAGVTDEDRDILWQLVRDSKRGVVHAMDEIRGKRSVSAFAQHVRDSGKNNNSSAHSVSAA